MQIESGTTSWWRNRHLMFLAMFLAFAAYFAYDGFYRWPAENVKWAAQAMQVSPDTVKANPRVKISTLQEVDAEFKKRGNVTFKEVVDELTVRLGEPNLSQGDTHWWVGPAMYVKAAIEDGKPILALEQSKEHSESSIQGQKYFAIGLLVLGGLVVLRLVRVMTTRIVVDESGLRYNSRHVPWEAMTGLQSDDYARKGWATLEYTDGGSTRSLRLDSYHVEKFNEIVGAICEKKGFTSPLGAPQAASEADNEDAPQP